MSSIGNEDPFEPGLGSGARVEVRNHFDGAWSGGFLVEAPLTEGYSLRRLSDRSVLPRLFNPDDVRLDVRRSG